MLKCCNAEEEKAEGGVQLDRISLCHHLLLCEGVDQDAELLRPLKLQPGNEVCVDISIEKPAAHTQNVMPWGSLVKSALLCCEYVTVNSFS
jgi:hypothetical protein